MSNRILAVIVTFCAFASPTVASAQTTIAPPGNAGASQYVEDVPTAAGTRPVTTIHPGKVSTRTPALPASTVRQLDAQGAAGRATAALAEATAPTTNATPSRPSRSGSARRTSKGTSGGSKSPPLATPSGDTVSAVASALTGADGTGPLLPALAIATLLVAIVLFALGRRRDP